MAENKKNLFLLHDTEAFMRGDLDNVTVLGSTILLDMVTGSYVPYGCYTSPAIPLPLFDALRVSWNADTPNGTVVEMQARVMVDGNWSGWCSFGKWSPYIRRAGAKPMTRGPISLLPDVLRLDSKLGSSAQLRIYLYTQNEKQTPSVGLLGVSVHAVDVIPASGRPLNVRLHLPPYCAERRAPNYRARMDLAISLASLTNRWGADLLPEEFAPAMYDWQEGCHENLSFAAATAACWGFPAWVCWTDLAGLRAELRAGYGTVVRLAATPTQLRDGFPEMRFAALRGFSGSDNQTRVLLNDPAASSDFAAEISLPIDDFMVAWDNLALCLRPRRACLPGCPTRTAVSLRLQGSAAPGVCQFTQNGTARCLPDDFCGTPELPGGILAWSSVDEIPHATTAHKIFHYAQPIQGGIALPVNPSAPVRHTVYAIEPSGCMMVGDITV
jgi:hypothetical protein